MPFLLYTGTSVAARLGSVEEKVVAAEEGQPPTPSHYGMRTLLAG